MKRFAAAGLAGLLAASAAAADPLPPDLAAAAHAYEAAQINGDGAALERLIDPGYVLVGGDGARQSKADLIAFFTAPGLDLEPVTVREPIEHVWAASAALGGTAELKGTDGGKAFAVTLRFMDVWEKRDGVWRVVYGQATRVPAAP